VSGELHYTDIVILNVDSFLRWLIDMIFYNMFYIIIDKMEGPLNLNANGEDLGMGYE